MRLLLVLCLLTTAFAGCLSSGGDGPALDTAQGAQAKADKAAGKWAQDAALVSVSGTEMDDAARKELRGQIEEFRDQVAQARSQGAGMDADLQEVEAFVALLDLLASSPDGDVGDGRAALWFYSYVAPSLPGQSYTVAVHRREAVYASADGEAGDEFGPGGNTALVGWKADSTVAAESAATSATPYGSLCDKESAVASMSLAMVGDKATWLVAVEAADEQAMVAVDAATGALAPVDPLLSSGLGEPDVLGQEAGFDQGAFTVAVEASITTQFDVKQSGHQQLAFEVRMNPAPLQPGSVVITDPDGNVTEVPLGPGQNSLDNAGSVVIANVPRGTYQVEVSVPLTARTSYQYTWCTDGTPLGDDDGGDLQACHLVQQGGASSLAETLSRFQGWTGAWPH